MKYILSYHTLCIQISSASRRERGTIYIRELIEKKRKSQNRTIAAGNLPRSLSYTVPALSYMINRATSGSLATKIISGAIYTGWDKDESLRRETPWVSREGSPFLLHALVTIPRMEIDGIPGRTIGKPELFRAVGTSILANLDRNDVNEVRHRPDADGGEFTL